MIVIEKHGDLKLVVGGKHGYVRVRGGQGSTKNLYQGYSKVWSVRNRAPCIARLDFLYGMRNRAVARLDSLGIIRSKESAKIFFAACRPGGQKSFAAMSCDVFHTTTN